MLIPGQYFDRSNKRLLTALRGERWGYRMRTRQRAAEWLSVGWAAVSQMAIVVLALALTFTSAWTAPATITDRGIREAIDDELLADPAVSPAHIDIDVKAGIVTLAGQVNNLLAKDRAVRRAEVVKGVRAVIDKLVVKPATEVSDSVLQQDIQTALRLHPLDRPDAIDVQVSDRAVTLRGTAQSWQESQLAARAVKGVRGITSLTNNIRVQPPAARSDADIKADIGRQLRWDARVDHALIEIDVEGGQVTLSGIVGSAAEKRIVVSDAWVTGVRAVDAAGLDVQKWARDPELRRDKYAVTSDKAIQEAVKDALLYDLRVTSSQVTPEVKDGVVTLSGTVATLAAKRAAAQDARHTVGVSRVKNQLKVRPPTSPAADALANEVRQAVARDPYLDLSEIHVHVDNGSVYLSGAVDSNFERARADNVAAGVPGVLAVNNNLGVRKGYDALVYNPYVDEGYGYDYSWYRPSAAAPGYSQKTDAEIKAEIQDELWWSPFVDADDMGVAVEDGVATLTGSVDSWAEWHAAIANAYEGGARRVVDKMLVK